MLNVFDQLLPVAQALDEADYAADPVRWAREVQDFEPDPWQAQFLRSNSLDIILNCSRQTGKTRLAGTKAAHRARYFPGSIVIIASHTQKQATFVQRWVAESCTKAQGGVGVVEWKKKKELDMWEYNPWTGGGEVVKKSVMSLELANGSRVESVPASSETVRGGSPHLIILDEAAYMTRDVYEAIRPMRANMENRCQLVLMSSAGYKRGFFYEEWIGEDEEWEKILVTADDCPRTTEEFLDRERRKVSDAVFMREYYCRFMDMEGGLLTMEQINSIFDNDNASRMRAEWERGMDLYDETVQCDILERIRRIQF